MTRRELVEALRQLPTFDKVEYYGWGGSDAAMEEQQGQVGNAVDGATVYGDWVQTEDLVRVMKSALVETLPPCPCCGDIVSCRGCEWTGENG